MASARHKIWLLEVTRYTWLLTRTCIVYFLIKYNVVVLTMSKVSAHGVVGYYMIVSLEKSNSQSPVTRSQCLLTVTRSLEFSMFQYGYSSFPLEPCRLLTRQRHLGNRRYRSCWDNQCSTRNKFIWNNEKENRLLS